MRKTALLLASGALIAFTGILDAQPRITGGTSYLLN